MGQNPSIMFAVQICAREGSPNPRQRNTGTRNVKTPLLRDPALGFPRISSPFCSFAFLGAPLFSTHQANNAMCFASFFAGARFFQPRKARKPDGPPKPGRPTRTPIGGLGGGCCRASLAPRSQDGVRKRFCGLGLCASGSKYKCKHD